MAHKPEVEHMNDWPEHHPSLEHKPTEFYFTLQTHISNLFHALSGHTHACCWGVKQPTNNMHHLGSFPLIRMTAMVLHVTYLIKIKIEEIKHF